MNRSGPPPSHRPRGRRVRPCPVVRKLYADVTRARTAAALIASRFISGKDGAAAMAGYGFLRRGARVYLDRGARKNGMKCIGRKLATALHTLHTRSPRLSYLKPRYDGCVCVCV